MTEEHTEDYGLASEPVCVSELDQIDNAKLPRPTNAVRTRYASTACALRNKLGSPLGRFCHEYIAVKGDGAEPTVTCVASEIADEDGRYHDVMGQLEPDAILSATSKGVEGFRNLVCAKCVAISWVESSTPEEIENL